MVSLIIFFKYVEDKEGDFIDLTTGLSIGKHNGIHQWTLGQRCRIGGKVEPYFVFKSDQDRNIIYVVSINILFSIKTTL